MSKSAFLLGGRSGMLLALAAAAALSPQRTYTSHAPEAHAEPKPDTRKKKEKRKAPRKARKVSRLGVSRGVR